MEATKITKHFKCHVCKTNNKEIPMECLHKAHRITVTTKTIFKFSPAVPFIPFEFNINGLHKELHK